MSVEQVPDRSAEAGRMFLAGKTQTEIALELGLTRGTISGILYRLRRKNLIPKTSPEEHSRRLSLAAGGTGVPRRIRKSRKKIERRKLLKDPTVIKQLTSVEPVTPPPEIPEGGLTIWELSFPISQCRFIQSNDLYCSKPTKGKSFCPYHQNLCFTHATYTRYG